MIGQRLKKLRKKHQLTQQALADKVGLNYVQIGRYEVGRATPSSDALVRLAQALGTTTDYLMNGSQQEAASVQLTDKELLRQFQEVQHLNAEDKHLVKTFLDAFLTKRHIQKLAH